MKIKAASGMFLVQGQYSPCDKAINSFQHTNKLSTPTKIKHKKYRLAVIEKPRCRDSVAMEWFD